MEARILLPLLWFGLLEHSSENFPVRIIASLDSSIASSHSM